MEIHKITPFTTPTYQTPNLYAALPAYETFPVFEQFAFKKRLRSSGFFTKIPFN